MRFTSAAAAIHYFFNHQWMRQEGDAAKLMVRVQYTVKGGGACTWLGMELGDLVRPLNQVKPKARAWAMYAYAGEGQYSRLQYVQIVAHVVSECRKQHGISDPDAKTIARLLALGRIAVEYQAHYEITKRPLISDAEICARAGIPQSNWKKIWSPRFLSMRDSLGELSGQALGPVYRRMQEVAEADGESCLS